MIFGAGAHEKLRGASQALDPNALTQRVRLYCYYGIRYQKAILNRVFGVPTSIIVLQLDLLGKFFLEPAPRIRHPSS